MVDLLHPEIIQPLVDEACATSRTVPVGDINSVNIKLVARGSAPKTVVALLVGAQREAEISSEDHRGIIAFTDGINQGVKALAA